jgi:hypothetical protein
MPIHALFIELNGSQIELSLHATATDALQALRKFAEDDRSCYDRPAAEQLPAEPGKLIQHLVSFCDVVDVRLWRCEELGTPAVVAEFEAA